MPVKNGKVQKYSNTTKKPMEKKKKPMKKKPMK